MFDFQRNQLFCIASFVRGAIVIIIVMILGFEPYDVRRPRSIN